MKRKELKLLLEYEIKFLRWGRKFEDGLKLLGLQNPEFMPNLPHENYEMLELVLNDLDVPQDSEIARDPYNDAYYEFWNGSSKNTKKLLKRFEEIKNENKKRIRK